jgi:hypothetical protein
MVLIKKVQQQANTFDKLCMNGDFSHVSLQETHVMSDLCSVINTFTTNKFCSNLFF